jgi:hypothetical protein
MFSYQIYKLLHFSGLAMAFLGLGGIMLHHYSNHDNLKAKAKILAFSLHGVGLLFMLTGGFGMLARLGLVNGLPGWVYAKLALWLLLGAMVGFAKRMKNAWIVSFMLVSIVVFSATLALYKPF